MPRFAHMSDIHIGAFRQPEMRELVLEAFETAVDICVAEKVSFVILAGDIFDSNVPDLYSVRRAAKKMKEATESGVRFYAVYGSHDFSPNYSSIVDVLDGAGLFTRAEDMTQSEGSVSLGFVADPSGPKICGISGRKLSLDKEAYRVLDRAALESEPGLKVFVFHGALEELRPPALDMMDAMPASWLPGGFSYYAGGHVHARSISALPGRRNIAFPGPLFATDYTELSELAHGGERGFFMVEFDEADVRSVSFVPVRTREVVDIRCGAEGKTAAEASKELAAAASMAEVAGRVVLLTVEGSLRSGRTSEVGLSAARKTLLSHGALNVIANTNKLVSDEYAMDPSKLRPPRLTERETFAREMARVKSAPPELSGDAGVAVALELLRELRQGKKENENRGEFEARVERVGKGILGLEGR